MALEGVQAASSGASARWKTRDRWYGGSCSERPGLAASALAGLRVRLAPRASPAAAVSRHAAASSTPSRRRLRRRRRSGCTRVGGTPSAAAPSTLRPAPRRAPSTSAPAKLPASTATPIEAPPFKAAALSDATLAARPPAARTARQAARTIRSGGRWMCRTKVGPPIGRAPSPRPSSLPRPANNAQGEGSTTHGSRQPLRTRARRDARIWSHGRTGGAGDRHAAPKRRVGGNMLLRDLPSPTTTSEGRPLQVVPYSLPALQVVPYSFCSAAARGNCTARPGFRYSCISLGRV